MPIREKSGSVLAEIKIYEMQGRLLKLLACECSTLLPLLSLPLRAGLILSALVAYIHSATANGFIRAAALCPFKDTHLAECMLTGKLHFPIKAAELFSSFIVGSGCLIRRFRVGRPGRSRLLAVGD